MVWERCEFSYVDAQKTNGIWHERWHIYVSSNIWREAALGNRNTSRFGIIWSHSVVLLHWRLEFSFILISFIVRTRWVFDWFFLSANRPESVLCRRYKRSSSSSNNFNGDICRPSGRHYQLFLRPNYSNQMVIFWWDFRLPNVSRRSEIWSYDKVLFSRLKRLFKVHSNLVYIGDSQSTKANLEIISFALIYCMNQCFRNPFCSPKLLWNLEIFIISSEFRNALRIFPLSRCLIHFSSSINKCKIPQNISISQFRFVLC